MKKRETLSFRRAARWFHKVQPKLLSRHKGDIVAVDPKTGRYFVGDDELDVAHQAMSALPGTIFGFFRVGYPVVHKFRPIRHGAQRHC
jgi:hypothetical protein